MATTVQDLNVRVNVEAKDKSKIVDVNKEIENTGKVAEKSAKSALDAYDKFAIGLSNVSGTAKMVGEALSKVADAGIGIGKSLIDSAAQMEMFKTSLNTAFQGDNAGAEKLLGTLKEIANVTPFATNEVIEAGIKLKAYGTEAEKIPAVLENIGNMASGMGKSLNQAVEAYADASTGELERLKEFGITKAMIDKQVNGALSETKDKSQQVALIMQGLNEIMVERFAGGMEKASKTLTGELSTLEGEFEDLKAQLGEELLPTAKQVVEGLTEIVRAIKEIDPETKKLALTIGGLVTGVAILGTALAGAVAVGASVLASVVSIAGAITSSTLAMGAMTAAAGAWVAIMGTAAQIAASFFMAFATGPGLIIAAAVAIEEITRRTFAWQEATAKLKQEDLEGSTKRYADALNEVREVMPDVTSAFEAFNKIQGVGIENLLKEEQGRKDVHAVLKLLVEEQIRLTDKRAEEKKTLDELYNLYAEGKATQAQIDQQRLIIESTDDLISGTQIYKEEINNATKAAEDNKTAVSQITPAITEAKNEAQEYAKALEEAKKNLEASMHNPEIVSPEDKARMLAYSEEQAKGVEEENKIYDEKIKTQAEKDKQAREDKKARQRAYWEWKWGGEEQSAEIEYNIAEKNQERINQGNAELLRYKELQGENTENLTEQLKILEQQEQSLRAEAQEYLKCIENGEQLGSTALETLGIYNNTLSEIENINKKLEEKNSLLSEEQNQLNENYKLYLDIKVLSGEITQSQADMMFADYLGKQNEALKEQVDLIIEKIELYGIGSLSEEDRKILEYWKAQNVELKSINEGLRETNSLTSDINKNTSNLTQNQQGYNAELDKSITKATELNNVTKSGLGGEYSTPGGLSSSGMGVADAAFTGANLRKGSSGLYNFDADYAAQYAESQKANAANATNPNEEAIAYNQAYTDAGWGSSFSQERQDYVGYSGFDNPRHDRKAFLAGEKYAGAVIKKSTDDMVKNVLGGMVNQVIKTDFGKQMKGIFNNNGGGGISAKSQGGGGIQYNNQTTINIDGAGLQGNSQVQNTMNNFLSSVKSVFGSNYAWGEK